jgi:hypothetical protein
MPTDIVAALVAQQNADYDTLQKDFYLTGTFRL